MKTSTFLRILALALVFVMLIGALGCNFGEIYDIEEPADNDDGEDGDTAKPTAKPTERPTEKPTEKPVQKPSDDEEPDEYPDDDPMIPDDDIDIGDFGLDFEGESIGVLMRDFKSSTREWYKQITEDVIDEAVAIRNELVQEGLNLELDYAYIPQGNYDSLKANFIDMIQNDVLNDFHYIDICANYGYIGANPQIRDFMANLADQDQFPYFDFDLPCWNQSLIENTFVNGRLHYVTGDLNLSTFDSAMALWYAKKFYNNVREPSDPASLQQLALDGGWTYEELYKYASRITRWNYGGDGLGITSPNSPNPTDVIPTAWQLDLVITNGNGTHSFNIAGNDRLRTAQQWYEQLFFADGTLTNASVWDMINGDCMMITTTVYPSTTEHKTMIDAGAEYELLPWPKFDEHQEDYATTSQDYYTLMSVLDHRHSSIPTKGEAVSAYLQMSTEVSYLSVRDVYFGYVVGLGGFYADDTARDIFDLIVDSLVFDFGTVYAPQLNDVVWLWRDAVCSGNTVEDNFYNDFDKFNTAISNTDRWLGLKK